MATVKGAAMDMLLGVAIPVGLGLILLAIRYTVSDHDMDGY